MAVYKSRYPLQGVVLFLLLFLFWTKDGWADDETSDTSCSWVCQPARDCHWVRRCYMKRLCSPRQSCHIVQYYLLDDEGKKVLFRKRKCETLQNCGYHNQCGLYNTCSLLPNCRAVCPKKQTAPGLAPKNIPSVPPKDTSSVPENRVVARTADTQANTVLTTPPTEARVVPTTPTIAVPSAQKTTQVSGQPIVPNPNVRIVAVPGVVARLPVKPLPTAPVVSSLTSCRLSLLERLLWFNLNHYRREQKLPELGCSSPLTEIARQWAEQHCQSKTWTTSYLQTRIQAADIKFARVAGLSAQAHSWRQALSSWSQDAQQQGFLKTATLSITGVGVVSCQQQFVWIVILLQDRAE